MWGLNVEAFFKKDIKIYIVNPIFAYLEEIIWAFILDHDTFVERK